MDEAPPADSGADAPDVPDAPAVEVSVPVDTATELAGQAAETDVDRSLIRSSAVMAAGTLLSRVTGLVRTLVAAWVLGQTALASVYAVTNVMPNMFYELLLGGVLTSVLVPVIVGQLGDDDPDDPDRGWREVANIFWIGMVVAIAASFGLALLSSVIIGFVLPADVASAPERSLAVILLNLFAAQVAFYALTALTTGILNARRHFAVPAFTPILNNVVVIVVLVLFAVADPTASIASLGTGEILLLGAGTTLGIAVMALAQIPRTRRVVRAAGGDLSFRFSLRSPVLRRLAVLSGWTVLYVATNQVGLLFMQRYANRGPEGDYAAWAQAFQFFQLPNGIIAVSVFTALLPGLAARWNSGDTAGFRLRFDQGFRLVSYLIVPAAIGLVLLATPMVGLLLQYGNFTASDTARTAEILRWMAIGLLPYTVFLLVLRSFYAMQRTRTPALVNVVVTAATVGAYALLYPSLGIEGLALAFSGSFVVAAAWLWLLLRRHTGGLEEAALLRSFVRILGAAVPTAAVVWAVGLPFAGTAGVAGRAAHLVAGVAAGLAVYVAMSKLLRVPEAGRFIEMVTSRIRRPPVTPGR
jgi:putative peptidoglycan lipid II flippase